MLEAVSHALAKAGCLFVFFDREGHVAGDKALVAESREPVSSGVTHCMFRYIVIYNTCLFFLFHIW